MKTYRTRISIVLLLLIVAAFAYATITEYKQGIWMDTAITAVVFVLILALLFSIRYVIDGETLKVYYFFFVHKDIDIKTITMMSPTFSPISSPAASLKRLAVYYGNNHVVYISPRHQDEFIEDIHGIIERANKAKKRAASTT